MTRQRTTLSIRQRLLLAKKTMTETDEQIPSKSTRKERLPLDYSPPTHLRLIYALVFYGSMLQPENKIRLLLQKFMVLIRFWRSYRRDVLKLQVFDCETLLLENVPGVWSDLQYYRAYLCMSWPTSVIDSIHPAKWRRPRKREKKKISVSTWFDFVYFFHYGPPIFWQMNSHM